MRILVVGGYGFIGSAIAKKLIQEKHSITILDDLSTGNKRNVQLSHKSFILNTTNKGCETIFLEGKFEVVIYAAHGSDLNYKLIQFHERSDNVLGLRHMLELSLKYKVGRFVYLSSYQVYDLFDESIDETSTPYPTSEEGREYVYQESFCKDYQKKGLEINILRLSNVYGPRLIKKSQNLITLACFHNKKNEEIKLNHHLDLFQDYIFVNDVADAVSKTISQEAPLILNISSNVKTLNSEIVNYCNDLSNVAPNERAVVSVDGYVEKCFYTLANDLALKTIGWAPQTDMKQGLATTIMWYDRNDFLIEVESHAPFSEEPKTKIWHRIQPYLETFAFFTAFAGLKLFLMQRLNINIDVMMVYIVFVAGFYGLSQAALAVAFTSLFFILNKMAGGMNLAYFMFDLNNVLTLIVYVLLGSITGYSLDKVKFKLRALKMDYKDIQTELKFVVGAYDKSIEVKNALQYEIEHYEDSFGKVVDITSKLNKVHPEEIYNQAAKVVAQILKAQSVCIIHLDYNGIYGRVMASFGNKKCKNSIVISENDYLAKVVKDKKIFTNNALDPVKPALVAPIIYNDRVVALALIDEVDFKNLSVRYVNMLKVVSLLISNAIDTASRYQEAIEAKKYIGKTQILKTEWFKEVLDIKKQAEQDELSTWYLFKLNMTVEACLKHYQKLSKIVRSSDYIGETKDNKIAVLFSNAQHTDRRFLRERLVEQGFAICEEV